MEIDKSKEEVAQYPVEGSTDGKAEADIDPGSEFVDGSRGGVLKVGINMFYSVQSQYSHTA